MTDQAHPSGAGTLPAALMSTVHRIGLPDQVLRELAEQPEEAGNILLDAVYHLRMAERPDLSLRLLEALRENPPAPEDEQYASIELAWHLRESEEADGRARAERVIEDLLRPGRLGEGPAGMLAEDLEETGHRKEALLCHNIASRELLLDSVDELAGLPARMLHPLIGRARVRADLGLVPDDHDLLAQGLSQRLMEEAAAEGTDEDPFDRAGTDWEQHLFDPAAGALGRDEEPAFSRTGPERRIRVFYSRQDFDTARARGLLTDRAADQGPDAHYRDAERELREHARQYPETAVSVLLCGVDELLAFAETHGTDPADEHTRHTWERIGVDPEDPRLHIWPPERNRPCWCGSARKYKKCCGSPALR
ncbi:SEC-C domain-containing protein [Nocardiopsis kunsanensis]|uniref:SEC-C domain-containing protein n=1 Tax=Nocardiopsis kunsanensis TaxID=141693 RepID=UPI000347A0D0|nr:SEC-C domain-containing protein [Nocardiopsis kunsanensis]